jgi:hypothetical protein
MRGRYDVKAVVETGDSQPAIILVAWLNSANQSPKLEIG